MTDGNDAKENNKRKVLLRRDAEEKKLKSRLVKKKENLCGKGLDEELLTELRKGKQ